MEPTRPKLPSEAVELYNKFIHGGMSRRAFVKRVQQRPAYRRALERGGPYTLA